MFQRDRDEKRDRKISYPLIHSLDDHRYCGTDSSTEPPPKSLMWVSGAQALEPSFFAFRSISHELYGKQRSWGENWYSGRKGWHDRLLHKAGTTRPNAYTRTKLQCKIYSQWITYYFGKTSTFLCLQEAVHHQDSDRNSSFYITSWLGSFLSIIILYGDFFHCTKFIFEKVWIDGRHWSCFKKRCNCYLSKWLLTCSSYFSKPHFLFPPFLNPNKCNNHLWLHLHISKYPFSMLTFRTSHSTRKRWRHMYHWWNAGFLLWHSKVLAFFGGQITSLSFKPFENLQSLQLKDSWWPSSACLNWLNPYPEYQTMDGKIQAAIPQMLGFCLMSELFNDIIPKMDFQCLFLSEILIANIFTEHND